MHVVTDTDREPGRSTTAGTDGKLTWRFRAENVRDVAWAASSRYVWDATNAAVGDANSDGKPDTALVESFWRPEQRVNHWDESARYARHSVEFFSKYLFPYPYPHMSAVDGPTSCGGMEYPMMTCIGGQWDTLGLYEVVNHEIGHMWFPMLVGSDEKRFAWMDEGLTQFDQSQAMADFFKGFDDEARNRKPYRRPGRSSAARSSSCTTATATPTTRPTAWRATTSRRRRWWRSAECWAGTCSTRRSRSMPGAGSTSTPPRTTSSPPSRT